MSPRAHGRRRRTASLVLLLAVVGAACTRAVSPADPTAPSSSARPSTHTPADATPSPLIDTSRIISGGPPPDGIPPIDEPKFLAPSDVHGLQPQEPVIAVEVNGVAKAYPVRIMIWHEIVNDDFDGKPVVVTYCPLCNTGIAYVRPTIDGELLDFGTSGKLYNSNLIMYDRQTDSYWPQAIGQAVVGPLTGTKLTFVPARILSWGDWLAANPDGLVLSTDTGFERQYGTNPYVGYDGSKDPFLFTGDPDPRLPATEHVLGVPGDQPIAFPYSALSMLGSGGATVVQGSFGGHELAIFWHVGTVSALDASQIADSADVGAAAAYMPKVNGQHLTFAARDGRFVDEQTGTTWTIDGRGVQGPLAGSQLDVGLAIDSFWFDWAAFHPDTAIYGTP